METEADTCDNCEGVRQFAPLGYVPSELLTDEEADTWVDVSMCTECGGLAVNSTTTDDVIRAEDKYINTLEECGLIDSYDADSLLEYEP